VRRICIQARPLESNEDRFSVEGILGIELAAPVLELPNLRRIEDGGTVDEEKTRFAL
jgi:hypothetical protein